MNLNINNSILHNKNTFITTFMQELQKNMKNNTFQENINNKISPKGTNIKMEESKILEPAENSKIITEYRDKINLKRNEILNNYAKKTTEKGEMFYIYDKNSKDENMYNICICEEGKSHIIIEKAQNELPQDAKIGTVLRKKDEKFISDFEATKTVSNEINKMKEELLKEQNEYLNSVRIENHVYELSEKQSDRAWLFDITSNSNEAIEEIEFPEELLAKAQEGDCFIYKNNQYKKIEN